MNYQWARDSVLKLIDRYSVAGSPMTLSYNNQADFVAKIPTLLDDAMSVIASTARKLPKTVLLSALPCETVGNAVFYTLPGDCMRALLPPVEGAWFPDDTCLAIPKGTEKGEWLTYYRRPVPLGENPEPMKELDGTEEMQRAAVYYAAACLLLHEDESAYKALLSEWERYLGRLTTLPRAETGTVQNVYGEGQI